MARSGVEWGSSSSRRRRWFRQSSPRKPTPSHLTSFAKNVKLAEWTEDPDSIASHKIIDCCFLPADLTLVKIENALRGSSRRSLDELSKQILWDPFVFENNSLRCLPFVFFVFFSSLSIRFDWQNCFFFSLFMDSSVYLCHWNKRCRSESILKDFWEPLIVFHL